MKNAQELLQHLILEQQNETTFIGLNSDIGSPNVFGGQVLAQAINAASRTITNGRALHSLHSYFLEAGNLKEPIEYQVEIIRDGGSFSTRRVTAHQRNTTIFILSCSFHKKEEGIEHQKPMKTNLKQPEELLSWTDMVAQFGTFLPKKLNAFLSIERPIEFKPVKMPNPMKAENLPPVLDVWFKVKGNTKNLELATKQQVLTYLSDYNILMACLNPNASVANMGNTQMASLDHSMWFFRDFNFDDWMLYSIESPNTFGARGLSNGNIYTRDGKLVASTAQEGLMRPQKK